MNDSKFGATGWEVSTIGSGQHSSELCQLASRAGAGPLAEAGLPPSTQHTSLG